MDEEYITRQLNRLLENGSSPAEIRHYLQSNGRQVTPEVADLLDQYQDMRRTDSRAKINARFVEGPARPDRGTTEAAMLGFGNGMTMGALPYAGAAVDSLGGTSGRPNIWNSDMSVRDLLARNSQMNQQRILDSQANHPHAYTSGEAASMGVGIGMAGLGARAGFNAGRAGAALTGGEVASAEMRTAAPYQNPSNNGSFNSALAEDLAQWRHEKSIDDAFGHYSPEYQASMKNPNIRAELERPIANHTGRGGLDDQYSRQMTSRTARDGRAIMETDRTAAEFNPEMAEQIRRWRAQNGETGNPPAPRDMGYSPNPRFR